MAMSAMRKRLLASWPLIAALVFSIYSWALLAHLHRSQSQLRAEAEHQQLVEGRARASAHALLFEDLRLRTLAVAESAELANYLMNRSLGMSLRYGLNANIFDIGERLRKLVEEVNHHGRTMFDRVYYMDETGRIIADTAGREALPIELPAAADRQSAWVVDQRGEHLITHASVGLRGQHAGLVVGIISLPALLADMLGNGSGGRVVERLLDREGRELMAAGRERLLPPEAISQILAAQRGKLEWITLRDAGAMDGRWLLDVRQVPDSDYLLVRLLSEDAVYGQADSSAFIYGAAVVPLLVIFSALLYQRMRSVGRALQDSRQRFETVFEHISDAIMVMPQSEFAVLEANPRMLSMFGLTRNELPQLGIDEISAGGPEYCRAVWLERQREARAGTVESFPWHARDRSGRHFWVEVSLFQAPVDGQPRMLVLMHDITRSKEQERALREMLSYQQQLNAKLEEAQTQLLQSEKMASIGQLAAGIAHEINNPIGFINANMGILKSYVEDLLAVMAAAEPREDAKRHGERAPRPDIDLELIREDFPALIRETQDGIERVIKIVRDMREFSHVDSNAWQLADLHVGLESTLNVVWNELKYKVEVRREYADIPSVECLPGQINQVAMNLLVNAAHAIPVRGHIVVRTGADDDVVWFEVEDDGVGIPPENLSRIFDPFFTTKPVGKGTGLGLSLVYGIVRNHDGNIDVQSEPGAGTRIRVSLPRQRSPGAGSCAVATELAMENG